MTKKFRMTIRELLLSNKDYSGFTKDELIAQHSIIMHEYDEFKNQMTSNFESKIISPNIVNIKTNQKKIQETMFANILKEVDSHILIIETLITSL